MTIKIEENNLYLELLKKVLTASIYNESAWTIKETHKNLLKNWLFKTLRKSNLLLVKAHRFNPARRELGKDWPLFGYTMVGKKRLDNIQFCVENVLRENVPGDFIETGAWRGGSVIFMRALLKFYGITDRKVWVADSFEGLPPPKNDTDGHDLSQVDMLKVSLEQVQENFKKFDLLDEQVEFLKGWFCDTLPSAPIEKLSILRLDGDMYHSTMDSLVNLYHKVSPGGYVIVDDYLSWPSCRQAVTDFLNKESLTPEIITIDTDGVFWKV